MIRSWIGRGCVLLLLLFVTLGEVMAQKMKVESFVELSQAEDPDAKDPTFRRADTQSSRSGKYCAIIKLITTVQDKNFSFDLGVDYVPEKVVYRDNGEVWIYVPAGTSKIKIAHKRYGQLDTRDGYYSFKEVGIPKCKEATVYRLRLYTDFNPDEDIIKDANKLATVRFNVHPAAATILLRKVPERVGDDGVLEKQMPLGIYHYRATFPDYHTLDGVFELQSENETKQIELRLNQAFGWLAVNSELKSDGYTFIVDGEEKELSDTSRIALKSGMHTVEVHHPSYYPQTLQVVIQDSVEHLLAPRLQPRLGYISVTANKLGAVVSIDGEEFGVTPMEDAYEILAGTHIVEVSLANYRTEKRTVVITEGQTTHLPITLIDMARYTFSSTPSAASLYIDGEHMGYTPCYADLTSGHYRVKLEHKKYRTIDKRMYLDSSTPEVAFRMARQYQRKYQLYFQPTFQYGTQASWGGTVGCYLANINVEGMYLVGKESDPIYWNSKGWEQQLPIEERFSPTTIAFSVGYGLIMGARLRLTPQIGMEVVSWEGSQGNRCYAHTVSASARIEYVVFNRFGICLVPSYVHPKYKSDNLVRISETLTQLDDYTSGLNLKIGCYLYF